MLETLQSGKLNMIRYNTIAGVSILLLFFYKREIVAWYFSVWLFDWTFSSTKEVFLKLLRITSHCRPFKSYTKMFFLSQRHCCLKKNSFGHEKSQVVSRLRKYSQILARQFLFCQWLWSFNLTSKFDTFNKWCQGCTDIGINIQGKWDLRKLLNFSNVFPGQNLYVCVSLGRIWLKSAKHCNRLTLHINSKTFTF